MSEVARLADQVVVLQGGKVVCEGPAEAVLSDPAALPLIGVREAGAVLHAVVAGHGTDGLSRLQTSGGDLIVPQVDAPVGAGLRIRVMAQDVILSLTRPTGISTRNILPVQVLAIHRGDGPGVAVQLALGQDKLLARITQAAAEELKLAPGLSCFAILKATAVPRSAIGT